MPYNIITIIYDLPCTKKNHFLLAQGNSHFQKR